MRHNNHNYRRTNSSKGGQNIITSFCNDIKVRGFTRQIADKWRELAEEAEKAGDRVLSELYFQQAEHYNKPVDCI